MSLISMITFQNSKSQLKINLSLVFTCMYSPISKISHHFNNNLNFISILCHFLMANSIISFLQNTISPTLLAVPMYLSALANSLIKEI